MTPSEWWPWALLCFAVPALFATVYASIVGDRSGHKYRDDFGLDAELRWKGRDVSFQPMEPDCASVRIAAVAPYRLRIAHESRVNKEIGGPAQIDCAIAPSNFVLWCDHEALPQQIFADRELAERLKITIRTAADVVELRPQAVCVDLGIARFESEHAATHAAWRAATTIVERLHLGIPEGGELPFMEIRFRRD